MKYYEPLEIDFGEDDFEVDQDDDYFQDDGYYDDDSPVEGLYREDIDLTTTSEFYDCYTRDYSVDTKISDTKPVNNPKRF